LRSLRTMTIFLAVMVPRRSLLLTVMFVSSVCCAQPGAGRDEIPGRRSGPYVRLEGGLVVNEDELRTARETATHSTDIATWTNAPGFESDVFTFARIIFHSDSSQSSGRRWWRSLGWWVDYPDADLNLSYRLQELTTIQTDPDGRVLKLTDPKIFDYPLLYMEHTGYMRLTDEEAGALRKYLLNGGALLVNDFWGSEEWNGFASQIQRVLPGRSWTELTTEHPVFRCVYDLRGPMNRLQVPTIQFWNRNHNPDDPTSPLQTRYRGEGSTEMHVRAMLDDRQRIMIVAIHNSDVSDGWEREGEDEVYFNQFSERVAYPLGINLIVYLMTH